MTEVDPNAGTAPAPTADAIADAARTARDKAGEKGLPPVHLWNPPFSGDLDMRIARDGTWFYLGTPINRMPLVKLFASVLRYDQEGEEDGAYYLVTPVEKVGITVDDAPFVAIDYRIEGTGREQVISFVTNLGDEAAAGEANPIRMVRDPETGEPSPYVLIRARLEALIDRKTFYRLVEICEHVEFNGEMWFGLWSGGVFYPFIPSDELPADERPRDTEG